MYTILTLYIENHQANSSSNITGLVSENIIHGLEWNLRDWNGHILIKMKGVEWIQMKRN